MHGGILGRSGFFGKRYIFTSFVSFTHIKWFLALAARFCVRDAVSLILDGLSKPAFIAVLFFYMDVTMLKLPPLSALRAFEAASRLGSVTRAAQELHVTHSAVSHQLKLLEAHLDISLIDRSTRRVSLTPEGRVYAYQVRLALQQVASATSRINMRSQSEHLTVALLPSFGMHWLVPRLPDFYAQHPNWRIELIAGLDIIDFDNSPADCAIRFGSVEMQGTHSEWLMPEWQMLVASTHDSRFSPTQTPEQAINVGKIIAANESWSNWFLAAGLDVTPPAPSLIINDSNLALEAAKNGLGAVLTRLSIAESWLKQGTLQRITPVVATYPSAYYLLWPNRSHKTDKLVVFTDWLKAQCRAFEQSTSALIAVHETVKPFGFLKAEHLSLTLKNAP